MKKNIIYKWAIVVMALCATNSIFSQQVNTLYFMKNIPERNAYNPSFQPIHSFYLDLPVMPNMRLDIGNNSIDFDDIIFSQKINGRDSTITFLHPEANKDDFYKSLRRTTRMNADFSFNLLGFGFRVKEKNYFTFGLSQKLSTGIYIPKDFFKILMYGTGSNYNNDFNFSTLGINASIYTELSLGYSRKINDKLTVGGNLKYLIGQANINTDIDRFDLKAGIDEWNVDAEGEINMSIPFVNIPINTEGNIDFDNIESQNSIGGSDIKNALLSSNFGLGIDLGASYKILPELELSASITDLGFIRWRENLTNASMNTNYRFTGVEYNSASDTNIEDRLDDLTDELEDAFSFENSNKAYTTFLSTRVNIGAEYSVVNDKIGFGLLSSNLITNKYLFSDITASANFRPVDWFSSSFSYSCINGQLSTIGFGVQLQVLPFNMYLAIDRIPLTFATKNYIPTNLTGSNLQMGMVLVFGNPKNKDNDKDGVKNKRDKCPDTPYGYLVDKKGCIIDDDNDGVANNVDNCPDTPENVAVDSVGCPFDTDMDKVPDFLDKCADTPQEARVDENGCPLDTDGDGVADYIDQCANTPKGIAVDAKGCPLDSDRDGVLDSEDQCLNTPAGVQVDEFGCPADADGDGVADYLDKCPNTPAAAKETIDAEGCPIDSDGDGVPDYKDNCPTMKGVATNFGCPEITASVKRIFEKALQGIEFESGKDVIKTKSHSILNQIVEVMKKNPDYRLVISGHTDNVGKPASNLTLSEKRADAVKNYLVRKGIDSERLTSKGLGDTQPVASNNTAAGRSKNRRVEFVVKFEE